MTLLPGSSERDRLDAGFDYRIPERSGQDAPEANHNMRANSSRCGKADEASAVHNSMRSTPSGSTTAQLRARSDAYEWATLR
jgi:hypothetical protein